MKVEGPVQEYSVNLAVIYIELLYQHDTITPCSTPHLPTSYRCASVRIK